MRCARGRLASLALAALIALALWAVLFGLFYLAIGIHEFHPTTGEQILGLFQCFALTIGDL